MKRLLCALCVLLLLSGCTSSVPAQETTLTITATTYPLYLFALDLTEGIPNVTVERLDTGSVSCLHDYTLSVNDMKKIERADVLALNGAGLEAFMSDALADTDAVVIDCSKGVDLLPATGHHDHDHGDDDHDHFDPHYWMDPLRAQIMVDNLRVGLSEVLPEHRDLLWENAVGNTLDTAYYTAHNALRIFEEEKISVPGLITFHDGFQYFANTLDLPLLRAIEEEAGSEASAKEIVDIARLVNELDIPVIFTEVNGSDATANAISRETDCSVVQLSMIMDGREPTEEDDSPTTPYEELFLNNVYTLINGFAGREVFTLP
ncbi:MAG: zinc ABC transporter substrate-binding protein [Ruminococcaceae bacterium]|nr:zinc ABC transporter substrate-binding protein [Oscillospiraceae bacterium]